MIQINLVPDIKGQYLAAQRKKRTILVSCIILSSVAVGSVALMLGLVGAQKIQLANAEKSINENMAKLDSIEDLDKILTVQNQLNTLQTLHQGKPVVSRLFSYLPQVTPNDVQLSGIELSMEPPTIIITGSANSLETINKFVDTLKFTNVTLDGQNQTAAFSVVVLDSFGKSAESNKYTFQISLQYDSALFNSANSNVQLIVPKITTTRSETERPSTLFDAPQETGQSEGAGQ